MRITAKKDILGELQTSLTCYLSPAPAASKRKVVRLEAGKRRSALASLKKLFRKVAPQMLAQLVVTRFADGAKAKLPYPTYAHAILQSDVLFDALPKPVWKSVDLQTWTRRRGESPTLMEQIIMARRNDVLPLCSTEALEGMAEKSTFLQAELEYLPIPSLTVKGIQSFQKAASKEISHRN